MEINVSDKLKVSRLIPANENIYVSPIISENKPQPIETDYVRDEYPDKFKYVKVKEWLQEINKSPELKIRLDKAWTVEDIEAVALEIITTHRRVGVDRLVESMYKWFTL